MTIIKTLEFPEKILYRWEIGDNFITFYDDVRYQRAGFYNILDFLSTTQKLIIVENGYYCSFEGSDNDRRKVKLSKQAYQKDICKISGL